MAVKIKITLPSIVIWRGSEVELFVAKALQGQSLTFVAESSILDRR